MDFNGNQNNSEISEKIEKISYVEVTVSTNCGEMNGFRYHAPKDEIELLDKQHQLEDHSIKLFRALKLTQGLWDAFDFSHILSKWRTISENMLSQVVGIQLGMETSRLLLEKVGDSFERFGEDETEEQEFFNKYGSFLFKINVQDEFTSIIEDVSQESLSMVVKKQIDRAAEIFQEHPELIDFALENMVYHCLLWSIQDLVGQSGWDAVRFDNLDELLDILNEQYLTDPSWLNHSNGQSIQMIGMHLASQYIEFLKNEPLTLTQLSKILFLDTFIVQKPEPFSAQKTALVRNHPVVISAISALIVPENLQKDRDGYGFFESHFPNQLVIKTFISAYQFTSGNPNLLAFEQAKQVAEKFDTSVASIHLVFSAYAQSLSRPWDGKFKVNCDDLIDLLGIRSKRKGHSLPKLRANMYQLVMTLQRIMVQAVRVEGDRARMMIEPTPIWHITPEVELQLGLNDFDHIDSVGFVISPGAWLDYCNGTENSSFSLDLFKLRQDSLALKIALVVSIMGETTWTAKELLEKAYGLFQIPDKIANSYQLRNQKRLFVNALRKLKEILRWQCEFDPSGNWLYSIVKIWKPQALNSISKRLELPSKDMTATVDGAIILDRLHRYLAPREERYVTQSDLAALIGVRQADISEVRSGKRPMGKTFWKKLEAFISTLDLNEQDKAFILGQSKAPIRIFANKLPLV